MFVSKRKLKEAGANEVLEKKTVELVWNRLKTSLNKIRQKKMRYIRNKQKVSSTAPCLLAMQRT
jgi:hypothetical protein